MASSRRKFLCKDCLIDTGKIHEHYFIQTETWLKATGSIIGMYCIGCLEQRLGRILIPDDFTKATVNNPKYDAKSQRLMNRMGY